MTAPQRDVRVTALWNEDRAQSPMTIDMRIGPDARVTSFWDLFGAFGLQTPNCQPFILRRDGSIDLGADARALTWRTDLREALIRVGSRFIVQWNEIDHGDYEIVKVAELGAKDSIR